LQDDVIDILDRNFLHKTLHALFLRGFPWWKARGVFGGVKTGREREEGRERERERGRKERAQFFCFVHKCMKSTC